MNSASKFKVTNNRWLISTTWERFSSLRAHQIFHSLDLSVTICTTIIREAAEICHHLSTTTKEITMCRWFIRIMSRSWSIERKGLWIIWQKTLIIIWTWCSTISMTMGDSKLTKTASPLSHSNKGYHRCQVLETEYPQDRTLLEVVEEAWETLKINFMITMPNSSKLQIIMSRFRILKWIYQMVETYREITWGTGSVHLFPIFRKRIR